MKTIVLPLFFYKKKVGLTLDVILNIMNFLPDYQPHRPHSLIISDVLVFPDTEELDSIKLDDRMACFIRVPLNIIIPTFLPSNIYLNDWLHLINLELSKFIVNGKDDFYHNFFLVLMELVLLK